MYKKYSTSIFLLTICILCRADSDDSASIDDTDEHIHHQHQHTYDESVAFETTKPLFVSSEWAQKRVDASYRPRAGEILVKDSTRYPSIVTPQDRLLVHRRNYWPTIDNAVTSLAAKAAAGANDVKNLLKVNLYNHVDNLNAAVEHKKHRINQFLVAAAQNAYQQNHPLLRDHYQQLQQQQQQQNQLPWFGKHLLLPQKQRLVQKPKPKPKPKPQVIVHTKTKPLPSTTISDGYVHTYDNSYVPPPYGRPERNPYKSMGVTSYKHFENTILKELEEKEERKVEATLHTLFDDQSILEETLLGTKPLSEEDDADHDQWQPLGSVNIIPEHSTLYASGEPYASNGGNGGNGVNSGTSGNYGNSGNGGNGGNGGNVGIGGNSFNSGNIGNGGKSVNIIPQQSTLFASSRPFSNSERRPQAVQPLNDIRPVCEHQNDVALSPTLFHPSGAVSYQEQQSAASEQSVNVVPHDAKKTRSRYQANHRTTLAPKHRSSTTLATTEKPNYPAYFIRQQQQAKKPTKKLQRGQSHAQKVLQRQKLGHQVHATAPTTASSLLYYPFNNTDDGFRPIIPNDISSSRIIKPSRNTATDTTLIVDAIVTTPSSTRRASSTPRTNIQAQSSNVRVSIVAAPVKPTTTTTTTSAAAPRSPDTNSVVRKTKKFTPTDKETHRTTSPPYKPAQKQSRGSIKFKASSSGL